MSESSSKINYEPVEFDPFGASPGVPAVPETADVVRQGIARMRAGKQPGWEYGGTPLGMFSKDPSGETHFDPWNAGFIGQARDALGTGDKMLSGQPVTRDEIDQAAGTVAGFGVGGGLRFDQPYRGSVLSVNKAGLNKVDGNGLPNPIADVPKLGYESKVTVPATEAPTTVLPAGTKPIKLPNTEIGSGTFYKPEVDLTAGKQPGTWTVWHGSRHLFDDFDFGQIGAGEGAQGFGTGIYAAQQPGIGSYYRNAGNYTAPFTRTEVPPTILLQDKPLTLPNSSAVDLWHPALQTPDMQTIKDSMGNPFSNFLSTLAKDTKANIAKNGMLPAEAFKASLSDAWLKLHDKMDTSAALASELTELREHPNYNSMTGSALPDQLSTHASNTVLDEIKDYASMDTGRYAANVLKRMDDPISFKMALSDVQNANYREMHQAQVFKDFMEKHAQDLDYQPGKVAWDGNGGHLYKVEINSHPDNWVDLDQPIWKQSSIAQNAISSAIDKFGVPDFHVGEPGLQTITRLERGNRNTDRSEVAEHFRNQGIHGYMYQDAYSRGLIASDPRSTRNFVIIDPDVAKVRGRGGVNFEEVDHDPFSQE